MKRFIFAWIAMAIVALSVLTLPSSALADGSETLGAPSIGIAAGSGAVAAGVGLADSQPGIIDLEVPAGTAVNQVLLYWEGQATSLVALDDTIVINGIEVTGLLIGGPDFFFTSGGVGVGSATYRADITGLGLVSPGLNALTVGGLTFDYANNGAGVIAIYSDGSAGGIQVLDGNDLAWVGFPAPRDATVPQTFTFAADAAERTATLDMFFSSATGVISTGGFRPSVIDIYIDGGLAGQVLDALMSTDGEEWDTVSLDVTVPAGATSITIHPRSDDHGTGLNPASFAWNAAALSLAPFVPPPPPPPPPEECDGQHRIGSFTLQLTSAPVAGPFDVLWFDGKGKPDIGSHNAASPATVNVGESFTVTADPGPQFNKNDVVVALVQDGQLISSFKVHVSCSDNPVAGVTTYGDGGTSALLEDFSLVEKVKVKGNSLKLKKGKGKKK